MKSEMLTYELLLIISYSITGGHRKHLQSSSDIRQKKTTVKTKKIVFIVKCIVGHYCDQMRPGLISQVSLKSYLAVGVEGLNLLTSSFLEKVTCLALAPALVPAVELDLGIAPVEYPVLVEIVMGSAETTSALISIISTLSPAPVLSLWWVGGLEVVVVVEGEGLVGSECWYVRLVNSTDSVRTRSLWNRAPAPVSGSDGPLSLLNLTTMSAAASLVVVKQSATLSQSLMHSSRHLAHRIQHDRQVIINPNVTVRARILACSDWMIIFSSQRLVQLVMFMMKCQNTTGIRLWGVRSNVNLVAEIGIQSLLIHSGVQSSFELISQFINYKYAVIYVGLKT